MTKTRKTAGAHPRNTAGLRKGDPSMQPGETSQMYRVRLQEGPRARWAAMTAQERGELIASALAAEEAPAQD